MKKFGKLALAGLLAIAVAGMTFTLRAEDKPAAEKKDAAAAKPKRDTQPFKGKITAADKTAQTITVGKQTYNVTSRTRFMKDGKPATFDDAKVGEEVGGQARKDGDKLNLVSLRIGPKPEDAGEKKKGESKK